MHFFANEALKSKATFAGALLSSPAGIAIAKHTCPIMALLRSIYLVLTLYCLFRNVIASSRHLSQQTPPITDCCQRLATINFTSNLPVIVVQQSSQNLIGQGDRVPLANLCTCGSNAEDYNGSAEARIRGNSSANNAKKSYRVALVDKDGENNNFELLGMPKENDFVFYGPEAERSLGLENYLTYNMFRSTGNSWGPRTVYAELFLTEQGQPLSIDDYMGVYLLVENIKRDKNRLNITKWDDTLPGPIKGGMLFAYENDNHGSGDIIAGPANGIDEPFVIEEPGSKDYTPAAGQALIDYVNAFQNALFSANFNSSLSNSTQLAEYNQYIDQQGMVDYFLMVEVTKNPDGYRGSTYFYKDLDAPIGGAIPWDYNEAYGLCCGFPIEGYNDAGVSGPGISGGSAISSNGWRFNICDDPERCVWHSSDGISIWFRALWRDPMWRGAVAARYAELRAGPWSDAAVIAIIGGAVEDLSQGASVRNYERWANVLDVEVPPGLPTGPGQWEARVEQLSEWLLERLGWMDEELAAVGVSESSRVQATEAECK